MEVHELTDQQRELALADGDLFAQACPGAGKTRAIVARFLRRTEEEPRKGVALISFTKAAIEEARTRCGDRLDTHRAPHFVGTFDSFINRFITRPLYVRQCGKTPQFVESWADTGHAGFHLRDMQNMPDFEMGWFTFDGQLRATLRDDWIPSQHRNMAEFAAANRSTLEWRATVLCQALARKGIVSCTASRALAAGHLAQPATAQRIGQLLADRFSEVIVDEAQDCGPEDLLVLRLLRRFGVTVVAVADLDQSIFAFRQVDPEKVRTLAASFRKRLVLDGNHRSTPAICAINNSLRFDTRQDRPVGEHRSSRVPVRLLEFKDQADVAPAVDEFLTLHGMSRTHAIFLAHREADALRCAGTRADSDRRSQNAVLGIAFAHAILRSTTSASGERHRAATTVERILRIIADVPEEDKFSLEERWLRETAYRLAISLSPARCTPSEYAEQVRQYVRRIQWPTGIVRRNDLGNVLRTPTAGTWPKPTKDSARMFAGATIHSVKGREFASVVVVLPQDLLKDNDGLHALDHWDRRSASELRRVLYVGASRAQQLLILAVHLDHRDRLVALLERDGVPHE